MEVGLLLPLFNSIQHIKDPIQLIALIFILGAVLLFFYIKKVSIYKELIKKNQIEIENLKNKFNEKVEKDENNS